MENKVVGIMYRGCVGDNDSVTVSLEGDAVSALYSDDNQKHFDTIEDAVRELVSEGYASFFGIVEEMYLDKEVKKMTTKEKLALMDEIEGRNKARIQEFEAR